MEQQPLPTTQELIEQECAALRDLLLDKNRKYGDSALNPVRIFSRADVIEQINVRMDDKLSRIVSSQDDDTEDPELDLLGYLLLKRVARRAGRIAEHRANRADRPIVIADPSNPCRTRTVGDLGNLVAERKGGFGPVDGVNA